MANDENKNEREVVEIELDEYNKMMSELKKLKEQNEKIQPKEVVKISREDYDKLMARIDAIDKKEKAAPVFGVPQNNMGLSVPYQPQKKSGWETVGKGLVGGAVVAGLMGLGAWLFRDHGSTGTDVF